MIDPVVKDGNVFKMERQISVPMGAACNGVLFLLGKAFSN
jgi:hypothetical protein